jgi:hypothetical protein
MRGFGSWLKDTDLTLTEVQRLKATAGNIGSNWPTESENRADYEASIRNALTDPKQAEALADLASVWPVYKIVTAQQVQQTLLSRPLSPGQSMTVQAIGAIVPGVIILYILYRAFGGLTLANLENPATARGILTFLFGVTTVGIAIIIVLSVFLGRTEDRDLLGERFQRGKDILTILIGVFGAILGFYFGQQTPQGGAGASSPAAAVSTQQPTPATPSTGPQPSPPGR